MAQPRREQSPSSQITDRHSAQPSQKTYQKTDLTVNTKDYPFNTPGTDRCSTNCCRRLSERIANIALYYPREIITYTHRTQTILAGWEVYSILYRHQTCTHPADHTISRIEPHIFTSKNSFKTEEHIDNYSPRTCDSTRNKTISTGPWNLEKSAILNSAKAPALREAINTIEGKETENGKSRTNTTSVAIPLLDNLVTPEDSGLLALSYGPRVTCLTDQESEYPYPTLHQSTDIVKPRPLHDQNPLDPIILCVTTTQGNHPIENLSATLRCTHKPIIYFVGTTDTSGRITQWQNTQGRNRSNGSYVDSFGGVGPCLQHLLENFETDVEFCDWELVPEAGRNKWEITISAEGGMGGGSMKFGQSLGEVMKIAIGWGDEGLVLREQFDDEDRKE